MYVGSVVKIGSKCFNFRQEQILKCLQARFQVTDGIATVPMACPPKV